MTIDFTCQKCDANFEIDVQDLIDGSEKLVCTSCEAKAPPNLVEDFVAALKEKRTTTRSSIYESYKSMVLHDAIRLSSETGQIVKPVYERL